MRSRNTFSIFLVLAVGGYFQALSQNIPDLVVKDWEALTKNGGEWITYDNTGDNDSYGMKFTWGLEKLSVNAQLYSLKESEMKRLFDFKVYYHPEKEEVVIEQYGWDGTLGIGTIVMSEGLKSENVSTFYNLDGTQFKLKHEQKIEGDLKTSQTYVLDKDGRWVKSRYYEWRRVLPTPVAFEGDNPLSFMTPYIGSWKSVSNQGNDNPEFVNMIGFHFEWADDKKQTIRFYEGYSPEKETQIVNSLLAYNPSTDQTEFLGFQVMNGLLFKGSFEKIDNGFLRLYKVWYPAESKNLDPVEKERGYVEWRDTCILEGDNLTCKTERKMPDGTLKPFDPKNPDGWVMKRMYP